MIPFLNRSTDIVLSPQLEARDVNVREVIDELQSQFEDFNCVFEAVVLLSPGRYRVTCKSSRKLEIFVSTGFLVRGTPVEFKPLSTFKWVNISRLSYGIPEEAVRQALAPYGNIRLFKLEQYSNVYTGVRQVLMEILKDIPARLQVAGHHCVVHYKGQKRICFSCGKEGHFSSKCPCKSSLPAVSSTVVPPVISSTPVNVGASTSTAGVEPPIRSFSAVVSGSEDQLEDGFSVISPVPAGTVAVQDPANTISSALAVLAEPSSVSASSIILDEVVGVIDTLITSVVSPGAQEPTLIVDATSVPIPVDEDESYFDAPVVPVAKSPTLVGKKRSRSRALSRSRSRSRSPAELQSRLESLSPLRKDRRSVSVSSFESARDEGSDSDDGLDPMSTPTFSPDNSSTNTANDNLDLPLTQFTPNLPCPTQDRITFNRPEDSSDEFSFSALCGRLSQVYSDQE